MIIIVCVEYPVSTLERTSIQDGLFVHLCCLQVFAVRLKRLHMVFEIFPVFPVQRIDKRFTNIRGRKRLSWHSLERKGDCQRVSKTLIPYPSPPCGLSLCLFADIHKHLLSMAVRALPQISWCQQTRCGEWRLVPGLMLSPFPPPLAATFSHSQSTACCPMTSLYTSCAQLCTKLALLQIQYAHVVLIARALRPYTVLSFCSAFFVMSVYKGWAILFFLVLHVSYFFVISPLVLHTDAIHSTADFSSPLVALPLPMCTFLYWSRRTNRRERLPWAQQKGVWIAYSQAHYLEFSQLICVWGVTVICDWGVCVCP